MTLAPEIPTRSKLMRELVTFLVAGRNCTLVGPDLLGKTPLLKDVQNCIAEETPLGVVTVMLDLQTRQGSAWENIVQCLLDACLKSGLRIPDDVDGTWHLSDILEKMLILRPDIERLIILFDHPDDLPQSSLRRLAAECYGSVNLAVNNPELARVAMLWCGDESRMAEPIARIQGFPRISVVRHVKPYSAEDVEGLLREYTRAFHLPRDTKFRTTVAELTGGLPGLVRHFGNSFMTRLTLETTGRLFSEHAETAIQTASDYVDAMLATVGQHLDDRRDVTTQVANSIVQRVSQNPELLSMVMCMRRSSSMTVAVDDFPGVATRNNDLFYENKGNIYCRGTIIREFVSKYFTFPRLAFCFFVLDTLRETLAKALLCSQLRDPKGGDTPTQTEHGTFSPFITERESFRFLAAMSARLHGSQSTEEALDWLLMMIRQFLHVPQCEVYEVRGGDISAIDIPANRVRVSIDGQTDGKTLPSDSPEVHRAIAKGRPQETEDKDSLVIPLQVGARVRYLVWIHGLRDCGASREMIQTAVALAEGPIAAAEDRRRQSELLQEFVDSNPEDRIQVVDQNRHIVLLSSRSRLDLGEADNPLGQKCEDVFGFKCGPYCDCEKVFSDGETHRSLQRWRDRSGTTGEGYLWFDVHAWPVKDGSGEIVSVCQVARDVFASVVSLEATGKLLGANTSEEVLDILISAAQAMGFARGRLYLCDDPDNNMTGELISHRCFGHEEPYTQEFMQHKRRLDGNKETYWYDVFKKYGTGVICVFGEEYLGVPPRHSGDLARVHVPKRLEQDSEVGQTRRVRAETALQSGDKCYGVLTVDMGENAKTVPEHLSHRIFELVRMAAQTLAAIDLLNRTKMMMRGFRHSLALPVGKFNMMIDTCATTEDAARRKLASRLAKSAMDDMFHLAENLATQFGGESARRQQTNLVYQDIVPNLKDVVTSFHTVYESHGYDIEYRGPEHSQAKVNERLLRAILRNLLANAIKAVQTPGLSTRQIRVSIVPSYHGNTQRIEVEDSGKGVLDKMGKTIYDLGVSGFRSTGIGLPACRDFAKMMNAVVDDEKGEELGGAKFYISFE